MAKITYIDQAGVARTIDVEEGRNLMEAAVAAGIPGIDGDCGGVCSCATCHVYVDERWLDVVGAAQSVESEMLGLAEDVRPGSRLACQLVVSEQIDGIVVHTPAQQGY